MKTRTRLGVGVAALSALAALVAVLGRRPAARAPVASRYPHVERRGANRAVNVVRPAFGQRSIAGGSSGAPGDWEAF